MEKNYKKYDEICATAIGWLLSYKKEHGNKNLCFINITSYDLEDKWLLSIAHALTAIDNSKIYVHINIIDYLYLKYKYNFKFIKYTFKTQKYSIIDSIEFENEIIEACKISYSILQDIYLTYYIGR